MTQIRISKEQEADFEILFSISKEKFLSILEVLKTENAGISPKIFSEKFSEQFDIKQDSLARIIRIVYSVNQIKISSGVNAETIIDDFAFALIKSGNGKFSEAQCKEYFQEILNLNDRVFLTVKTAEVIAEREKFLQDFDLSIDIRPIFEKNELKGMAFVQTLKLEYIENEKDKRVIYLAIDDSDLNKLEKAIQATKVKKEILKQNVSGNIVNLE